MRRFLLIAAVGMIAGPANAGIVPASPYDLANLVQRGQTQQAAQVNPPRINWSSYSWRALSAPSRGNAARQSASHRQFTQTTGSSKPITVKRPTITSSMMTDIQPIAPVVLELPHLGGGFLAQSIGGSGGNGGMMQTLAGNGGKGGTATPPIGGRGIMAQSIGSSGSDGIMMQAVAGNGGKGGVKRQSIGGSGGNGGVSIAAQPLDSGDFGIFAQSIGGSSGLASVSVVAPENGKSGGGTSVAVSAVPLPAGVLMLGPLIGFGAAAAVYRRRRAAKQAGGARAG